MIRSVFSSCWGVFFWLIFCGVSLSFAVDGRSPVISGVEIWVDGVPSGEPAENLIFLREGSPFSLKDISENIKQIYRTGLFSDVQVLKSGDERVGLKFMLTRKVAVRKINFQGNTGVPGRRLRSALYAMRAEVNFSDEKLGRSVEELKRVLREQGYFQPEIRTALNRVPTAPQVDVTFIVEAGRRFVIDSIGFQGNGVVPEKDLRAKMKSRAGEVYIPSRLEQDIQRLKDSFGELGYRRAEIGLAAEKFNDEGRTVSLVLQVTPNERIDIVIEGADVPARLIEPIWEEKIFEEWGLGEGEARILSYLRDRGFIFASVHSSIERTDSEIKVIHDVSPRQQYKIRGVRFEGNSYFSAAELKNRLAIPQRSIIFPVIDGKKAFDLPPQVRRLYEAEGFPDVIVDLNFSGENRAATAIYFIREGEQQKIKEIAISGAELFSLQTLRSQMDLVEGGPFFSPAVQRAVQSLETFYLNQGVRGTRVETKTESLGGAFYRVNFDLQEGKRVKVRSLIIAGNTDTKTSTIRREIKIKKDAAANYSSIMTSKSNLEKLGIFSEVKVDEIPVAEGEENLVFTVREGQRNYVGLGVGLETKDAPLTSTITNTSLRLRGTAEFMRSNILGQAASLSLVGQFSLQEKRAVVSWQQPYFFFSLPVETYFNAWVEAEDRISFNYEGEGVSLTVIRPQAGGLTLLSTLRYARTTLTDLKISPSEIDRQFYPYSITSVSPSIVIERRNDPFNPEKGYFASLALEWAFPLFDTESDFAKMVFKYQHFLPVLPQLTLGSTFRLGLGSGRIPIHERFFAGGSYSFRGQRFDELGPQDPVYGNPVGGKALAVCNFDLTFPLVTALDNLFGAVFLDAGNVFAHRRDLDLAELEYALGLGVRYRTPLGPVRLDLGWNLTDPERKGKPLIFVTIGNVF